MFLASTMSGLNVRNGRESGLTMRKPFDGYRGRRNSPKPLCSRRWPLGNPGRRTGAGRALFPRGKCLISQVPPRPGAASLRCICVVLLIVGLVVGIFSRRIVAAFSVFVLCVACLRKLRGGDPLVILSLVAVVFSCTSHHLPLQSSPSEHSRVALQDNPVSSISFPHTPAF